MSNDNIEDIYPLSSTQAGLFFHQLQHPQEALYFNQYCCTLTGKLDADRYAESWQHLMTQHPILRSCFLWQGLEKALQVVKKEVVLPWHFQDWQGIPADQQQRQLTHLLQQDRQQGIALDKAPVFRLSLIQLAAEQYQFIWSFHHILLDRWSVELLLEALWRYYFNAQALPKSPPYKTFINYLQKRDTLAEQQFWQHYLADFSSPTRLLATLDPIPQGNGSAEVVHTLTAESSRSLQQAARTARLTMNTLLQGAWAIVLSCYSGESDVLFGNTVAGRPARLANIEKMVGLCINTLPVRIQVKPQAHTSEWLQSIQNQQLTTRPYENASLVEIQASSEIKADTALFDSLLVFENIPANDSILQTHLELQVDNIKQIERSHYPLAIIVCPGDCLAIHAIYDKQYYTQQTVSDILQQLANVLQQIPSKLHQPVAELSLLTTEQREQLLQSGHQSQVKHPHYQTIQQLISEQMQSYPDACAIRFAGQDLSYQELESQTDALAHYLMQQNITNTAPLAILLPRGTDYLIAILGILKAGAAYLPLNPEQPVQRLTELLRDAANPLLLTNKDFAECAAQLPATRVLLTSEWNTQTEVHYNVPAAPSPLAYFIYTSGSTGKPKAVRVTQKNLLHSTQARLNYYAAPLQRLLLLPAFSFDSSVAGIFWTLAQGGTLCLPEPGVEKDPQRLCALIAQEKISHILLLPSLYQLILEHATAIQLSTLKTVIVAGEVCPPALAQQHYQCLANVPLYNEYGPTEATVWSSVYKIPPQTQESSIAIGQPIANTRIYVLSDNNQPVPLGVIGEICIAGAGVADGYHHASALTAEKFIPSPFANHPGSRIYKTGDLGRYRADGNLEFLGRKDQQIKFLGYRIEPEEIRSVINQYPGISESVVIAKEEQGSIVGLIAYLQIKEQNVSIEKNALKDYLNTYLPHYMVPAHFIELSEFPLNTNGKLNTNALPSIELDSSAANGFIPPSNPTEQQLAEIWQTLFNTDLISIEDDFFELGGHSLLAVSLLDKISNTFQKKISLESLWQNAATIRAMAELIDQQQQNEVSVIKRVARSTDKPV